VVKRASGIELALGSRPARVPAQRWLHGALRDAILAGRLRPGARLPSTREMATSVRLARGTVVAAFEQLTAEGYLDASVGSGTYVSAVLPDDLLHAVATSAGAPRATAAPRRSRFAVHLPVLAPFKTKPVRAFRAHIPAVDELPAGLWAQLIARRARRLSTSQLLAGDPCGYLPLRRAIADHLAAARGVVADPAQIVVVSSVLEAIDLVTRVVVDPGDRVCMEEPGYHHARLLFAAAGARVVPIAVDGDGMRVPGARHHGARLVYVTPAHQYPLGVAMSLARRLELLAWARRAGALVLEDDYDSEFRYASQPLPALHGLDRGGAVAFTGCFSKAMFPALRLGYLVVPPGLVDRIAAVRAVTQRFLPPVEQAALCDFLAQGHFARHVRRTRQLYAHRAGVLGDVARQYLAGLVELPPVQAGLHAVGWLVDRRLRGDAVERAADAAGIEALSVACTYRGPVPREGLLLGFAALRDRELRRGAEALARVLEAQKIASASLRLRARR
jgi:GntR family transcriptional regulator/MocR family aminotransferase